MMKKLTGKYITKIIELILLILIITLLYWRFQLALVRYFDVDELTHLHWGYNFFVGLRPYTDFLYLTPPLFLIVLYPIFLIWGKTAAVLPAARVVEFGIFLGLLGILFILVRKIRDRKTALLTALVLAFLPLPYDKFLEVRPDTLAVVFILFGVYFLVRIVQGQKRLFFFSGLCFSLAYITSPKIIYFFPAVFLVLCLSFIWLKFTAKQVVPFIFGLSLPVVLTLALFIYWGNLTRAVYLTTGFVYSISKTLGDKFFMLPNLFFYPNDTYYGEPGLSLPLILNLIIYLSASVWAVAKFVSFLDKRQRQESIVELLLASAYLANLIAFIMFIPLKHAQYLINSAPLVAFYFADLLIATEKYFRKVKLNWIFTIGFLGFLALLGYRSFVVYRIKSNWKNTATLTNLDKVARLIPQDEYVFDLVGTTLFYKDPYYICCLPYGQYEEVFAFKLPSLEKALSATQTKYIYLQEQGRLSIIPENQAKFIKEHYIVGEQSPTILVAGTKLKFDRFTKEQDFDLIISGFYTILSNNTVLSRQQVNQLMLIDGGKTAENPVYLTAGDHHIQASLDGELILRFTNKERLMTEYASESI